MSFRTFYFTLSPAAITLFHHEASKNIKKQGEQEGSSDAISRQRTLTARKESDLLRKARVKINVACEHSRR